ncbi:MAG TPA: response regulator transcription factor [Pyrinomonadaceae bacterium]|jgi:DNA-binding NarL/FixJ family response regulator
MARRLLVVDDEAKLLKAVAATLRAEDYEVLTARSGAEALVNVSRMIPDLIISDIRMPGMDGFELARVLRANPRTALIPIIFLTAKGERKDRIAGLRTGVDAYLAKPFDPDELLAVVSGILSRIERTGAEIARLVSSVKGEDADPHELNFDVDFTEAERRVAALVADGLSNKEAAAALGVSVRTVEGHISNILSKKGWSNRVEIARHIIKRRPSA